MESEPSGACLLFQFALRIRFTLTWHTRLVIRVYHIMHRLSPP